jgi:hypothetical protein
MKATTELCHQSADLHRHVAIIGWGYTSWEWGGGVDTSIKDGFLYSASAVSLGVITVIRKKNQIIYLYNIILLLLY